MEKTMRIGKVKIGKMKMDVFIKAEYNGGKLSISGVIGPMPSGNAYGGCGQIGMEFQHRNPEDDDKRYTEPIKPSEIDFAPGWDREKWFDLLDIWKKWHLNDMQAGTDKQTEALKGHDHDYTKSVEYLKSINLYDDNGYKYGSAWLKKEVPGDVIDKLNNLPDADINPEWI